MNDANPIDEASTRRSPVEESLLSTIFESSPDYIYFKDLDSRFVRFSHSFMRHFKVTDETMLRGKTDFDFFGVEISQAARDEELQVMRSGTPLVGKIEKSPTLDGRINWFLTTKTPWRDPDGSIIGIFGISKDITALKEAEEQLEKVHRQLVTVSREAGMAEIATNVLHNVGNVLNSVVVSTGLIGTRLRESKTKGFVDAMRLMDEHRAGLGDFLSKDERGKRLPPEARRNPDRRAHLPPR